MIERNAQEPQFWIAVVAQDRVERARKGGYAELNNGRAGMLELLHAGDVFLTYSPRAADPKGEPVQAFTSVGCVGDGPLSRVDMPDGTSCFRLPVTYLEAHPAPIRPLLDLLTFIRNRQHWGAAFRFGALRIGARDYLTIASAMGVQQSEVQDRAA